MEITIVSGSPIFTLSATLPSTDSPLYIFIEVDGMAAVATKGLLVPNPLQMKNALKSGKLITLNNNWLNDKIQKKAKETYSTSKLDTSVFSSVRYRHLMW